MYLDTARRGGSHSLSAVGRHQAVQNLLRRRAQESTTLATRRNEGSQEMRVFGQRSSRRQD